MLDLLIAGALGGIVRGVVGFVKHQFAYKKVEFNAVYFLGMVALSALVGMSTAWVGANLNISLTVTEPINPAMAFVAGYAGGDFIENLYKILIGKTTLFPTKK